MGTVSETGGGTIWTRLTGKGALERHPGRPGLSAAFLCSQQTDHTSKLEALKGLADHSTVEYGVSRVCTILLRSMATPSLLQACCKASQPLAVLPLKRTAGCRVWESELCGDR